MRILDLRNEGSQRDRGEEGGMVYLGIVEMGRNCNFRW